MFSGINEKDNEEQQRPSSFQNSQNNLYTPDGKCNFFFGFLYQPHIIFAFHDENISLFSPCTKQHSQMISLLSLFSESLLKLKTDFENFSVQCMRKISVLTSMTTDILSEIKTFKETIHNFKSSFSHHQKSQESIFNKVNLPVKNLEEMGEFENYLSVEDNFSEAVMYLLFLK